MSTSQRFVGEVVELSRDCELGQEADRAVVTAIVGHYMTLTFLDRAPDFRDMHTGRDYKYLRPYARFVDPELAAVSIKARTKGPAPRASLEAPETFPSLLSDTFWDHLREVVKALDVPPSPLVAAPPEEPLAPATPDDRAFEIFGGGARRSRLRDIGLRGRRH